MERFKALIESLGLIPRDIYAIVILGAGIAVLLHGLKDAGMLIAGGGLSAFKGDKE